MAVKVALLVAFVMAAQVSSSGFFHEVPGDGWLDTWFSEPTRAPADSFSYSGFNGPEQWALDFPQCAGFQQSPIDLDAASMLRLLPPRRLRWWRYWSAPLNMTLTNNGHTVQLKGTWPEQQEPSLTGGPLGGEYVFDNLHFHWGGSEHTVHNVSFPMEMHVVHYKREYGSVERAMQYEDGITVVAFFFKISGVDNAGLEELVQPMRRVQGTLATVSLDTFPLDALLEPFYKEYVVYSGSLTTPPCTEDVTWIVAARPLLISPPQMHVFRNMNLDDNVRPVQPRNGRPVFYVG